MQTNAYSLTSLGESLTYVVQRSSASNKGQYKLLIALAADWQTTLGQEPYRRPAVDFIDHGHAVLSFDLPCHGERAGSYGHQIEGFCYALLQGDDPFLRTVRNVSDVIDDYLQHHDRKPEEILIYGISRGGYMALRALAADGRISRAAAFAPVTDWSMLREFAQVKDEAQVRALHLQHYVDQLAGKSAFMAIGHRDQRVSTLSCCSLYVEWCKACAARGYSAELIDFYCTEDEGHTMGAASYRRGTQFLLHHSG